MARRRRWHRRSRPPLRQPAHTPARARAPPFPPNPGRGAGPRVRGRACPGVPHLDHRQPDHRGRARLLTPSRRCSTRRTSRRRGWRRRRRRRSWPRRSDGARLRAAAACAPSRACACAVRGPRRGWWLVWWFLVGQQRRSRRPPCNNMLGVDKRVVSVQGLMVAPGPPHQPCSDRWQIQETTERTEGSPVTGLPLARCGPCSSAAGRQPGAVQRDRSKSMPLPLPDTRVLAELPLPDRCLCLLCAAGQVPKPALHTDGATFSLPSLSSDL